MKRNTQLTDNILEQYKTLQFEGNLLTCLPCKCFTDNKMILKKLMADFFCQDLVWAPIPYTTYHFV